ncbi:NAD(P)H-binding protein [Phytoactinopolyspora limicola]|uniref:NAD(P)H-binding protein n=1 Tax=Phytoactinopolyspora limicola TaxID=2715536 RepID=UPI00140857D1|nr:NAD(P)H-binding protein [Phytoactinopolyspora limicola]
MYAVTGATGQIGGRVARLLAEQRHDLRLVVRDSGRAPHLDGVDVEEATYGDFDAMRAALVGVDVVFLVSATEAEDRVAQHITAVNAAAAAGVRRVVYLSFLGAAADATFTFARDHWATEEHIRTLDGVAWTFLRPCLYLDLLPLWASGSDAAIRGPAGSGRATWVARDDLAAVAVAVLTGDGHDGQTYDVTGAPLSLEEAAAVLGEAAGRDVAYVPETLAEARVSRAPSGAPAWAIEGWVTSYAAIATGEMNVASDTVQRLTGRTPGTLVEYLDSHPDAVEHLRADEPHEGK